MELSMMERLMILDLLPPEGSYVTLKVTRQTIDKVGFTDQEIKAWNIRQEDNLVKWDTEKSHDTEIDIGEKAKELIAEQLKKMSEDKKLTQQHFSLYEKFVGDSNG
jgi:hypothetical protein